MGKTAINLIDLSISQSTDKLSGHPFNNTVYPYPPLGYLLPCRQNPANHTEFKKSEKAVLSIPPRVNPMRLFDCFPINKFILFVV
jgi:hypothetical protein